MNPIALVHSIRLVLFAFTTAGGFHEPLPAVQVVVLHELAGTEALARRDFAFLKLFRGCAKRFPSLAPTLFGGVSEFGRKLGWIEAPAALDPDLQTKLLRVLQEGEFERIGSPETCKVDVRIVAATNRDLHQAIKLNSFRPDLYYRLAVFPVEVPPLRRRRDDMPLLVWHFITKKQGRLGKTIERIPATVMQTLTEYDWPDNIRELENVIEREMILSALQSCHWKIKGAGNAAERLGLKASTLRDRMKTLGIQRPPNDQD